MRIRRDTPVSLAARVLLGGLLVASCASVGPRVRDAIGPSPVDVASAIVRGEVLDVVLHGASVNRRLYFANESPCADLLREGASLTFQRSGLLGRVVADDGQGCDPVGTGSLRSLRESRPRRPDVRGLPRKPAEFRIVYEDDAYWFVRGRFTLSGLLDWPRAADSIAVLPRTDACRPAVKRGQATTEFRASGTHPLLVVSDGGYCPILGLIAPSGPPG